MGVGWKRCFTLFLSIYSSIVFSATNNTIRVANLIDHTSSIPPYRWTADCHPDGPITGVVSHLVNKAFYDLGLDAEWVTGKVSYESSSDEVEKKYLDLQSGELDFLVTARDPAGDDRILTLVEPLIMHRVVLITEKDSFKYDGDSESLKAYTGGVFYPLIKYTMIRQYLDQTSLAVNNYLNDYSALTALANREVDYVLSDYFIGKLWAYEHQQELLFHDIDMVVGDKDILKRGVYLVVGKGSRHTELLAKLDLLLADYRRNGIIEYLRQIYLTQWIENPCA